MKKGLSVELKGPQIFLYLFQFNYSVDLNNNKGKLESDAFS